MPRPPRSVVFWYGSQRQDYYNLNAEWALAPVDTPMRFTNAFTYALPFGKRKRFLSKSKWMAYAVGGWQLNGTIIHQTGSRSSFTSRT